MDPGLKIVTSAESKQCDALTKKMEGMHAHDLMDRATQRIFQQLLPLIPNNTPVSIFCGPGDNGADGLCLASMLASRNYPIETQVCLLGKTPSPALAFRMSLYAGQKAVNMQILEHVNDVNIQKNCIIIDALFGTGITRPLQNEWKFLVESINASRCKVISIDTPSGLLDEPSNESTANIEATKVIAIQSPKPSLLYPENKVDFTVVDCGIQTDTINTTRYFLNHPDPRVEAHMQTLLPERRKHSHKGTYGHTLLMGGNKGMHGAIAMAAKSCYEAGSGLTTVLSPASSIPYLSHLPQIMHLQLELDENSVAMLPADKYRSVALGPGLGNTNETRSLVIATLKRFRLPIILDADALNILADNPELTGLIPENSLLTPHPAEFTRLFGQTCNGKDKEELALLKAKEMGIYILAKNTFSFLACPDGKVFYNGTGDSRLARGGSGDSLTGMIAGLFAQNGNMRDAALTGMYFSGLGRKLI